nr:MAG TPA: Mature oligodendrocyte transmembrane protein [Caudoviricetes sp.]
MNKLFYTILGSISLLFLIVCISLNIAFKNRKDKHE